MQTLQIIIKDPEAEKRLQELVEQDLIEIDTVKDDPPHEICRSAGWAKDIIARVNPSFDDPLEEFKGYE